MYSNPPLTGAHLVAKILGDKAMKHRWFVEVRSPLLSENLYMHCSSVAVLTLQLSRVWSLATPSPPKCSLSLTSMDAFLSALCSVPDATLSCQPLTSVINTILLACLSIR